MMIHFYEFENGSCLIEDFPFIKNNNGLSLTYFWSIFSIKISQTTFRIKLQDFFLDKIFGKILQKKIIIFFWIQTLCCFFIWFGHGLTLKSFPLFSNLMFYLNELRSVIFIENISVGKKRNGHWLWVHRLQI